MIKAVRVANFKSFALLEATFGDFNVIVGANASGKSNLIQIFRFLRDLTAFELDNAISLQGGTKYLRNLKIGKSQDFVIQVTTDQPMTFTLRQRTDGHIARGRVIAVSRQVIHKLAIHFRKRGEGFEIAEDSLTITADFNYRPGLVPLRDLGGSHSRSVREEPSLGTGQIRFSNEKGRPRLQIDLPENPHVRRDQIQPPQELLGESRLPPRRTIAFGLPAFYLFPIQHNLLDYVFRNIGWYDFDPKLSKRAVQITGKAELDDEGNNLALVLSSVIRDRKKKRKLSNLVRDLLPFVEELGVESIADKSLLIKLRERYLKKSYLPASLLSDGTISLAALIVALYFEEKAVVVIEEPERNIHPFLMSKVVSMMKDASRSKQIIITTHNPGVVRYAGIESLRFLSRDDNGFSRLTTPQDSKEVKIFLENEIGVDELFSQNLLGVGDPS